MAKYIVDAIRTHYYTVELEAEDELDALSQLDDWETDDFEPYQTNAMWEFDTNEKEEN
jgi:hypothetical protein